MRGHTLIWNDNAPDWLKRLSGREVERVFDEHIDASSRRYAGKLYAWDVVNEPFWPMDGKPGGWRDGPWFAAMGPAYVERAFRRVAAIDKTARLTLNEAQCDNDHEWGRSIRPLLAELVERLLDAGAPLDAIGLQSHLRPQWPPTIPPSPNISRGFGAKGLDGLDHRIRRQRRFASRRHRRARPRGRRDRRRRSSTPALAVPAVKMVVNWQLSDRYSWYRAAQPRSGRAARRAPCPSTSGVRSPRGAMARLAAGDAISASLAPARGQGRGREQ